ncbi:hypothetical protein [Lactococcus hircilactis]|nr:hypothetical protein [Lactococcus hircilactis]
MSEDTPEEELEKTEDYYEACGDNDYYEACGDNDYIIGQFSNWNQLKKEMTDDEGWCPYSDEYLQSVFEEDNQ